MTAEIYNFPTQSNWSVLDLMAEVVSIDRQEELERLLSQGSQIGVSLVQRARELGLNMNEDGTICRK